MSDLSLNDLVGVVQIIDLASTRGAFRGEELLAVGTVRERIATYIKTEQQQTKEETETE